MQTFFSGIVIDVTAQAESHKNYQIQVRDLERYETSYGVIPNGAIVLFNTGWGKYADNATVYTGIDENKILNFPGKKLIVDKFIMVLKIRIHLLTLL